MKGRGVENKEGNELMYAKITFVLSVFYTGVTMQFIHTMSTIKTKKTKNSNNNNASSCCNIYSDGSF